MWETGSSIGALVSGFERRRFSVTEVIEATLDRIARIDPDLHSYLVVFEEARSAAAMADRAIRDQRKLGPLLGVPVSVKDLILTREAPTTGGSRTFGAGLPAGRDATCVRRLRRAGAIIVGKVNLFFLEVGATTENEHFGPTRNPWDRTRIPGGSSGGSGAAVAAGLCVASVGTDTRGSIRIPAACCGVTGLKPTHGLVSLDGVIPFSPSLDHVGPLCRSVEDAAIVLAVMAGGRARLAGYRSAVRRSLRGIRIAVSEYHTTRLDSQVGRAIETAIGVFQRLGCRIETARVAGLAEAEEASAVIAWSDACAFHEARLRDNPDGFGPLLRSRLEKGARWRAVDLIRAERARVNVRRELARAFERYHALIGATLPCLPPKLGEGSVTIDGQRADLIENVTRLNAPQNMAGVPAVSIPAGQSSEQLPIGLQLIADRQREDVLLAMGAAFQRETDWHSRRPPASRQELSSE